MAENEMMDTEFHVVKKSEPDFLQERDRDQPGPVNMAENEMMDTEFHVVNNSEPDFLQERDSDQPGPVDDELMNAEVSVVSSAVEPEVFLGRKEEAVSLERAKDRRSGRVGRSMSSFTEADEKRTFLFSHMADCPWPYLLILPLAFALMIGYGWSMDDKIEQEVSKLWISQDGDYAADTRYGSSLGMSDLYASSFAAMGISRDGGNILTASRLEEVRARMEATENTTLEYKGVTYTWADFCAEVSVAYESPCLRLSAMDLYKEARWSFTNQERATFFYENLIQDLLIAPRLPRFGTLITECPEECAYVLAYRTDPESLGYPAEVANPLLLVADVGNLEYNDPCRICIEAEYSAAITNTHASIEPLFTTLRQQLIRARGTNSSDTRKDAELLDIADKLGQLATSLTTNDVVEFYIYYVARGLYGEMGVEGYLEGYSAFGEYIDQCVAFGGFLGLTCPPTPEEVDAETAKQHLFNHADNEFSSVVSSGAPMPFWNKADGTGPLLLADENGKLHPVSGSGVNMSAPLDSLTTYMGYLYLQREMVDLESREWKDMVEANPLYSWFMASLTPANGTMCGNGNLTGTNTGTDGLDIPSAELLANNTPRWCTEFSVPNPTNPGTGSYSKQHFARMWYDLLMTSESLLNVVQGVDDPYSWTLGTGCGYQLGGERFSYTGKSEKDILYNSSRLVYNIDEGALLGTMDRSLLIGGANPPVGEYDFDNPLKEVTVLQTLYAALVPESFVNRVANCKRPGGPIAISIKDAETIIIKYKEAMENVWNKGWDDDNDGEVQFVSFFDDSGVIGSTGRMLNAITLDNNTLMIISIILIAVFSVLFLFSFDLIQSRVLLTLLGVGLVVFAYFAGVAVGLLLDIKINVSIAWTLPFVMIGLGVDDVYIVLLAIKKQNGYTRHHFLKAMKEVVVPVTMTSAVNAVMFAVMNLSDVGAIFETSRVACYCVVTLYVSVIFCFPAYCYLDLVRQEAGRMDVLFCLKSKSQGKKEDAISTFLYDKIFKPIVLGPNKTIRSLMHITIFGVSLTLLAVASWGVTEREVGLGLEDFFPQNNPAGRWAAMRTQELASWNIGMNWGALNYTDPDTQMKVIKQFEDVVATPNVAYADTSGLWLASFAIWTSRHCSYNFGREDFNVKKCGRDQMFEEDSYCSGMWVENKFGLHEKNFVNITDTTCQAEKGGVCRPGSQMHIDDLKELGLNETSAQGRSFCPVIDGWSDEKWQFCLKQWRNITESGSRFVLADAQGSPTECSGVYNMDEDFVWPMPFSEGPLLFAINLYTHQTTLDMMDAVRAICDNNNDDIHCWMTGIPFDYWEQYDGIFESLVTLSLYATLAGFAISFIFLFGKLYYEKNHPTRRILAGSLAGSLLIVVSIVCTLVTVVGLSILFGVSLTGFSNLAFILSIGFAVEYSVHIVSRWMRANMSHTTSLDRVDYTMSFLMMPTFMSFVSSTIGVICLAFTEFDFNKVFFFRPLMIVMFVSYWYGCWFLPTLLIYLDFDVVKLGKPISRGNMTLAVLETRSIQDDDVYTDSGQTTKGRFTPDKLFTRDSSVLTQGLSEVQDDYCPTVKNPDPPTGLTVMIAPLMEMASGESDRDESSSVKAPDDDSSVVQC